MADLLAEEEAGLEMADLSVETEDLWKIRLHLDAIVESRSITEGMG